MKLIRKKKRLWKSLKTNGSADLFLKFKDLRRKTKKLINSRYQQYLQSLSGKLQENPKHFWAFSILSNLRQNEFLKLLFMYTLGLGTVKLFNVFFHSVHSESTIDVNLWATDVVNPNLLSAITTILYSSRA